MACCESRATPPGNETGDPARRADLDQARQPIGQPARRVGRGRASSTTCGAGHLDAAALGPVGEQRRRAAPRRPRRGAARRRDRLPRPLSPACAPPRLGRWRDAASRRAPTSSARSASSSPSTPRCRASAAPPSSWRCRSSRRCCSVTSSARARVGRLLGRLPGAARPAAARPASSARAGRVLGVGDERGDPLLPAVVPAQPLDPDRIDELGHGAGGDGGGGSRRRPRWPAATARAPPSAAAAARRNGFSAAGYASGGRSFWPSAAMATANSIAERSDAVLSTAPAAAGARRWTSSPTLRGPRGAGSSSARTANTWSTNRCLTRTGVRASHAGASDDRAVGGFGAVQRSFDDLGTPLADVTFCVLDLETTGGDRNDDTITEVGAVKVRGGEFLGTFQTLVNPGRAHPAADHHAHRADRRPRGAGAAHRGRAAVAARVPRAARSSSATTSASTWRSCAPPSSAPATRRFDPVRGRHRGAGPPARARRGAGLPPGHAGVAVPPRPQARPTGPSTTPSPPPICCTC